jgi:ribonuclease R
MIIEGIIKMKPNGSGYIHYDKGEIYVYKTNTERALHNDEVVAVKLEGKNEAKVLKVIKRNKEIFTGVIKKVKDYGFLINDSKNIPVDFFLTPEQCNKYSSNEKLLVKLTKWEVDKRPECEIIRSLGLFGENDAEIDSILINYNLNPDFSKEVDNEAESISWEITDEEIKKRRDFRNTTTFTIDPDTAKDFDDALSIERKGDLYEIGIHIADVSHYVKEGSELDKEAYNRATSVYLVDRVVPMLPERLSNGICSLRPNEEKLTYSVVIKCDSYGVIKDHWIGRTVINSDRRYTYDEVQEIINGKGDKYRNELLSLNVIAQNMRKKRKSLFFNKSELKFQLDDDYKPIGVKVNESNESHQLIEEFMLVANKKVGEYLSDKKIGIYRTHAEPNEEKLLELKNICKEIGYEFNMNDVRSSLNKLANDVKDTPFENMIGSLSIKSMSKAKYQMNNIGHFGLDFDHYTHFTSPIRRYPDVVAHRLITKFMSNQNIGNPTRYEKIYEHCNSMEKNAKEAERESIKYKQVEFLLDKVGNVFMGTITGIVPWGIYVEINENKCEGLIRTEDVNGRISPEQYKVFMVGGKKYKLGDSLMVKVKNVSMLKKEIDLNFF